MARRRLPDPRPSPNRAGDAARHTPALAQIRADVEALKVATDKTRRALRTDGWQNTATGLGIAGADWRQQTTLQSDTPLDFLQTDVLYAQDSLAAVIVDALPEDACRRWIKISGGEGNNASDFQTEIFEHFKRLKVKQRFTEWLKKGRKDGGCALLIGADDAPTAEETGLDPTVFQTDPQNGPLAQPLDPENVHEIRHLHLLERIMLWPGDMDGDPTSDTYGAPEFYYLLPQPLYGITAKPQGNMSTWTRIHASRLFVHDGIQVSQRVKATLRGWGYSALQRPLESIQNYRTLWGHIATCFKHVAQTVVKLDGMADLMTDVDGPAALTARLNMIQRQRSTLNVVALDAKDELVEQAIGGIASALSVFDYCQQDLSQATNMPLTKLFGHQPKGFSDGDGAGERNWYDFVRATQEERMEEPLTLLILLLANAYGIEQPEQWTVDFIPLQEPTEAEVATTRLQRAQEAQIYVELSSVDPDEIRETLRADPRNVYVLKDGPAEGDTTGIIDPSLLPPPPEDDTSPPGGGSGDGGDRVVRGDAWHEDYGTSEGARKGWETRRRNAQAVDPRITTAMAQSGGAEKIKAEREAMVHAKEKTAAEEKRAAAAKEKRAAAAKEKAIVAAAEKARKSGGSAQYERMVQHGKDVAAMPHSQRLRTALSGVIADGVLGEDGSHAANVRAEIRGIVARHGLVSHDVAKPGGNRIFVGTEYVDTHNSARRKAFPDNSQAVHLWDGGSGIRPFYAQGVVRGLTEGHDRASSEHLAILVHEEIHGHSPIHPHAYERAGQTVEEVTTELSSRHITQHETGFPVSGTYHETIKALSDLGEAHGMWKAGNAKTTMTRAGLDMRKYSTVQAHTPEELVSHFVAHIPGDHTPEKRAAFAQAIHKEFDEKPIRG